MASQWSEIPCNKCKKRISADALICPFCRTEFTAAEAEVRKKHNDQQNKAGLQGCLILAVLAGLVLWGVKSCSTDDEIENKAKTKVQAAPTAVMDGIHLSGWKAEAKASGFTDCNEGFMTTCDMVNPTTFLGIKIKRAYVVMDGPDYHYDGVKVTFDTDDIEKLGTEVETWLNDPSDDVIEVNLNRTKRYHPKVPVKLESYPTGFKQLEFKAISKADWQAVKDRIAKAEKFRNEMKAP